jgi:hypothetical protein
VPNTVYVAESTVKVKVILGTSNMKTLKEIAILFLRCNFFVEEPKYGKYKQHISCDCWSLGPDHSMYGAVMTAGKRTVHSIVAKKYKGSSYRSVLVICLKSTNQFWGNL